MKPKDESQFAVGELPDLYRVLGARPAPGGYHFAVWAPSAAKISVVGDFNQWDGRANPMEKTGFSGVWEVFIPDLKPGERYKFEILTASGALYTKADPFAIQGELRPGNTSILSDYTTFKWTDHDWRAKKRDYATQPMLIYELHLASWKQKDGAFLSYRELAPLLVDYVLEMGYTHVELLPLMEHPLDDSWGYQVSGYFAPTSRHGSLADCQYFVNYMHEKGIGVILDWVPCHFPTDPFALGHFDGTSLYEHEDPGQRYHPHWETFVFEFGSRKVANFLIASAIFWLKEMHFDGLRVDAVASMLYLDYGRNYGQWRPNDTGGNYNYDAIAFLQKLNTTIDKIVPGSVIIAEESTAFPGITSPVSEGGLGFEMKWNMGWMHDTLHYFSTPAAEKKAHHRDLTFSQVYFYNERFLLPFSHDEVVHGKGSLFQKIPGSIEERFAGMRLLYSYLICQPGKKLIFMGAEFAQFNEWNFAKQLDWDLLEFAVHEQYRNMVKALNHFYLGHPSLWERDFDRSGFEWVHFSDLENSVVSYLRKSKTETLLIVHHFKQGYFPVYYLPLAGYTSIKPLFNTNDPDWGGTGEQILAPEVTASGVTITLPPLSTQIFELS